MAVYYKFKGEKNYSSICVVGPFITVANLKRKIFHKRYVNRVTDRDLEITNAQTNEVYLDEEMLIPKSTSVLVRRIPMHTSSRLIAYQNELKVQIINEYDLPVETDKTLYHVSGAKDDEASKLDDEFGDEIYAPVPVQTPIQASNAVQHDPALTRFKTAIETPALNLQRKTDIGFGAGRDFGRGGRMLSEHDFDGFEWRKPPQGYVCHRCNNPGHFIQHCPTNGDPDYNIRKFVRPTGIPKSMLMSNSEGSFVQPDGGSFEKEIDRIPTTSSQGDLPPELFCPLCKEVMKDAVLTRKCCFRSFCDKCVRNYIISKSICVCNAKNVLCDDLIPNMTLRDTISRILESSTSSSSGNPRSVSQLQAWHSQPKGSLATQSAVEEKSAVLLQPPTQQNSEKLKMDKVPDILKATHDSDCSRESAPLGSAPSFEEEVTKKVTANAVNKKKKKEQLPETGIQMQCRDNFVMPMCPSTYKCDPYWTQFQPGMNTYTTPFGSGTPFHMGYGSWPRNTPFPYIAPNVSFMEQNPLFYMVPPQREMLKESDHGRKEISCVDDLQSTKPKSNKRKSEHHNSSSMETKRHTREINSRTRG